MAKAVDESNVVIDNDVDYLGALKVAVDLAYTFVDCSVDTDLPYVAAGKKMCFAVVVESGR